MIVKIFVEGIADIKFLKDYILEKYDTTLTHGEDIIETRGWTNIRSEIDGELVRNKMSQNSENDGVNLVIFDADSDYIDRLNELNEWGIEYGLDFKIFLWPNNKECGDLETLLERIINPINKPIFDCWENYESCLLQKEIEGRDHPLTIPAKKTKIYGYLEALLGETKSQKKKVKEENRNYKNKTHWDLDSEPLNDLKLFLDEYFE